MTKITVGYIKIADWNGKNLYPNWMRQEDRQGEYREEILKNHPNDIVLERNKIFNLVIDYPLTKPFEKMICTGKNGMTRLQLARKVAKCYYRIYREEEESTRIPVVFGLHVPKFNRDRTNGKYGIFGPRLGDLILHTVKLNKKKKRLTVECDAAIV